ncbi:hypothetical protein B0H11DRAFT_2048527, partial [Mycena galericulata]
SPPNLTLRDAPHLWLRFDGEDRIHACLRALPSKHRTSQQTYQCTVPGHCIRGGTTSCIVDERDLRHDIDSLLLHTANAMHLGRIRLRHAWDLRQAATCARSKCHNEERRRAALDQYSTQRGPAGGRDPLLPQLRVRRVTLVGRRPHRRRLRR